MAWIRPSIRGWADDVVNTMKHFMLSALEPLAAKNDWFIVPHLYICSLTALLN